MRFVLTVIAALVASGLAGSMVGVVTAEWARGDESYILVFMAVTLVALVAALVFIVAWFRPVPARAINRSAAALTILLLLCLVGLCAIELSTAPVMVIAWRGIQLALALVGSCIAAVLTQWAIFRLRSQPRQPVTFGRAGSLS